MRVLVANIVNAAANPLRPVIAADWQGEPSEADYMGLQSKASLGKHLQGRYFIVRENGFHHFPDPIDRFSSIQKRRSSESQVQTASLLELPADSCGIDGEGRLKGNCKFMDVERIYGDHLPRKKISSH
jgi:hypothetical protein